MVDHGGGGVDGDANRVELLVAHRVRVARYLGQEPRDVARIRRVRVRIRVGVIRARGGGTRAEGSRVESGGEQGNVCERRLAGIGEAFPVVAEGVDGVVAASEAEGGRRGDAVLDHLVVVVVVGSVGGGGLAGAAPEDARGEPHGGGGHPRRAIHERRALLLVPALPRRDLRVSRNVARHLRSRASQ